MIDTIRLKKKKQEKGVIVFGANYRFEYVAVQMAGPAGPAVWTVPEYKGQFES